MYDVILKNASVVDGSGRDAYVADVGIVGKHIVKIGDLSEAESGKTIDLSGKILAPGFIDMHSHSDTVILGYPRMESMLHQGITTFVGCQCGHSIAPVGRYWEGSQALYPLLCELSDKLFPDMYDADYYSDTDAIVPLIERDLGFSPTWKTMGAFLEEVDAQGLSGNMIVLAGYNTLRMNHSDPDTARPLLEKEKVIIKEHIRECMEAGAFGLSSGLDYKPGIFATTDELVDMVGEIQPYDGIYFSHWRKTGLRSGTPKRQSKIDGIREAIDIGDRAGVQVQLSHLSTGYDVFPTDDAPMQLAAVHRTIEVVEEYIARGSRVYYDVIPNITGGTTIAPDLVALFRPWYMYTNGIELFVCNLKHPDYRKQLSDIIRSGGYFRLNPRIAPDWARTFEVIGCKNESLIGKTIQEIADERGNDALEVTFDLMVEDPEIKVFSATFSSTEETVKAFLNHPRAAVGNDTFVFDMASTLKYDPKFPNKKPNPNTYCGFIKYLTVFGRRRIEDSIKAITSLPATILGLTDRGFVKENYRADLVVIDPCNLHTNENLIEPEDYPSGVVHVLVNGTFVLLDGKHTGALPGGSIRRQTR